MASLYVPSRTGLPVTPGALLYFYQTGTTTPQNTYSQSDLAGGHVNTNPVVADANGVFGPIYLLASPDYKAVWTNPTASLSFTTDPLLTASVGVITTQGDLIRGNASGVAERLAIGSSATYLRSNGTTEAWSALEAADLSGTVAKLSMPAGAIIQDVLVTTNAYSTHTTSIPYDNTIPQITEGELLLTAAITPTSTSTRVRASVLVWIDGNATSATVALFRGAGANAISVGGIFTNGVDTQLPTPVEFDDVPGSVSSQSYTVRVGPNSGTVYVNGNSSSRLFGGSMISSIRLQEIAV